MSKINLTHRDYFAIALPFIISTVTQPLLGAVDTAVVGHLDSAVFIGGVAIGTVVMNTLYWLFGFFRVSTTGQSAIALGSGSKEDMAASLLRPSCLALLVGVVFILLQKGIWLGAMAIIAPEPDVAEQARIYFEILIWGAPFVLLNYTVIGWLMGQAQAKATVLTQVTGNVLNIVLDILFVWYFDFGVAGVAFASLIAQISTLGLGLLFVFRREGATILAYLHTARLNKADVLATMSSNMDLVVRTVCLLIMFNSMAKVGASLGANTLASNAVLMQLTFITSYLFDGVANASSVFSGKSVGSKDTALLQRTFLLTTQWTIGLIVLSTFFVGFFGEQIGYLFTDIPEVLSGYMAIQHWAVLFPAVAGFGLTFYGIFTGSNTTRPVRNSTIMALALFLVSLLVFVDMWGNNGLWLAFTLFYVGRGVFLLPHCGKVRAKTFA